MVPVRAQLPALFSMALTRVAKNQRVRNGATTATTLVRPEARDVAVGDAT